MNQKPWSGPHGPTVRTLSGQVNPIGPSHKMRTKSGPNATPPPKAGVAWPGPFEVINCNTDDLNEPSDEDIWLEGVARQVETDARPLFVASWIWLLRRALQVD